MNSPEPDLFSLICVPKEPSSLLLRNSLLQTSKGKAREVNLLRTAKSPKLPPEQLHTPIKNNHKQLNSVIMSVFKVIWVVGLVCSFILGACAQGGPYAPASKESSPNPIKDVYPFGVTGTFNSSIFVSRLDLWCCLSESNAD